MKILTPKELRSIEQFFQLSQSSLLKAMKQYLEEQYGKDKVVASKDFILAIGDIPVALTAHLDTVFKYLPQNIFYDRVKNVMWSPDGLGADDRAGVYSIVQLIKRGLHPTIILTTDEELGCKGAEAFIKILPQAPIDLKYIIELDRRGSDDCVFYQCDNHEFDAYVEKFGFVTNFGSFSDISVICPAWGIAGVNLSIGYYDEHSYSETLYIGQMFNTINKVENMLKDANNAPYFEYRELTNPAWLTNYIKQEAAADADAIDWDPSFGIAKEDWQSFMAPQAKCADCEEWDYDYNLFPVMEENGKEIVICADCLSKRKDVYWCHACGSPFIDKNASINEAIYCKACRGKENDGSK